jgi:ribulose-5-phosphate 4-epimerase/fuculose-1-phosphate aldolase
MESERTLRELICELGRRMYDKNLVSATDGNLSVKLEPGIAI